MKTNFTLLVPFLSFVFLVSCVDDTIDFEEYNYRPGDYQVLSQVLNLPETPFTYTPELPQYMTQTGLVPRPVSNNLATLGRVLFYDKALSKNGTTSCASCHKQELAFSDGLKFSKGFEGKETARNSLALGSVVSFASNYGSSTSGGLSFFWDDRAATASEQSLISITDGIEMGMTRTELVNAVNSKNYYKILFETAYQDKEITEEKILLALESFVDGIGSFESKLDQAIEHHLKTTGHFFALENQDLNNLSRSENRGKDLFVANCGTCHGRRMASPDIPNANNGLDMVYADKGIGAIQNNSSFDGFFKVPTLRNIAFTGPYMHDGRFETLEQVLDFYSSNVQNHKNLSRVLRIDQDSDKDPVKFNFSQQDKQDIIAFLHTLTDYKMMGYEKYSDPFK